MIEEETMLEKLMSLHSKNPTLFQEAMDNISMERVQEKERFKKDADKIKKKFEEKIIKLKTKYKERNGALFSRVLIATYKEAKKGFSEKLTKKEMRKKEKQFKHVYEAEKDELSPETEEATTDE